MIKVLIADDHEIFRDGFKLMLSRNKYVELIGEAENGRELVQMARELQPDVIITDIKMPIMDGIEATRKIKAELPRIGIIGLSMFDEEEQIMEMLDAGASGYLLKNADKDEVQEAIRQVYLEKTYYCKGTSKKLATLVARSRHAGPRQEKIDFNEREISIIQLICEEYTNKEIADRLYMSVRTVEGYRQRLIERMQVKNTAGLVIYAIQHGLYRPK
jgi:DNA-binding NarL/FixJ family response regulator